MRNTEIKLLLNEEEALHICTTLENGRDPEAEEHLSQLPFAICDAIRAAVHNTPAGSDVALNFEPDRD